MTNPKIFSSKLGLDWVVKVITFTDHFWISGFEMWSKWLLGPLLLEFRSVIISDSGKSLSPTSLGFYEVPRSRTHILSQEFTSFVCLGILILLYPGACNQSLIWVEIWSHACSTTLVYLVCQSAELGGRRHTFKSWLWNLFFNTLSLYKPQFHHLQKRKMTLFQSLCRVIGAK